MSLIFSFGPPTTWQVSAGQCKGVMLKHDTDALSVSLLCTDVHNGIRCIPSGIMYVKYFYENFSTDDYACGDSQ